MSAAELHLKFAPLASTVQCELMFGSDPEEIRRISGAPHVDHLVGLLSRCGYDVIATELWLAAHKESTA